MRTLRSVWLAAIIVLCAVVAVGAAEDGDWKFPSLNPFKSDKPAKKRASASVSDKGDSLFHMPKVPSLPAPSMPFTKKATPPRRAAPKGPSTMDKVSHGTKSFFSKTYDVLTPWDNDAPKKPSTRLRSPAKAKADSQSSWFPWFHSNSEPKKVETVSQFIGQPRVEP